MSAMGGHLIRYAHAAGLDPADPATAERAQAELDRSTELREEPTDPTLCPWLTGYGLPWSTFCGRRKDPADMFCSAHIFCEACNAEPGEPCRPGCIGQAAHDDA